MKVTSYTVELDLRRTSPLIVKSKEPSNKGGSWTFTDLLRTKSKASSLYNFKGKV